MLYPENMAHQTFIDFIANDLGIVWYAMLHDKDIYGENVWDDEGKIVHKIGEPKKPHWHFCFRLDRPRTVKSVAHSLQYYEIEPNLVTSCDAFFYTRYLTHITFQHTSRKNCDKHYYDPSLIIGDKNAFWKNYNVKGNDEESTIIFNMLEHIDTTQGKYYSMLDALKVFDEFGLRSVVLNNQSYFKILQDIIYNKRRKKDEVCS